MRLIFFIIILAFFEVELNAQLTFPSTRPHLPEWAYNQPIYEVNIGQITKEGTFKSFEEQLPRLKKLGVGIIYLMPIHKKGGFSIRPEVIDSIGGSPLPVPKSYRGKPSNSPYCIKDHYSIYAPYGTKADFQDLVDAIHQHGMYVIMDLVINHTSWTHVLVESHPEFYQRNDKGFVEYTAPWTDIASLITRTGKYGNIWKMFVDTG